MPFSKGWIILGCLATLFVLSAPCNGMMRGKCSNCHTMHNSEQGSPVAFTRNSLNQPVLREQPFAKLLKTDCVGCHSDSGGETIVFQGQTRIPIVFNMVEPTYPANGNSSSALAGGNFFWVSQIGDQYGHNIAAISGQDLRLASAPGGESVTDECATCHQSLATEQTGCNGCHVPFHHAPGIEAVAGKNEGWFRFLGSVMERGNNTEATTDGVSGIEDPDWEQNPTSTKHNVYLGSTASYGSFLNTKTIDQKCVGCHSRFHDETIANSTWIRHPVDMTVPDSGEYSNFSTYDPLVPVARQNVTADDADFDAIKRGSDLVSCLSCHRAHGSPYPAMLRWAYRAWPGIDPYTGEQAVDGCAVCHTAKD